MAAEKNQQYLLLQADSRVCGIDLMKLIKPKKEEEAFDWENQSPLPFDITVDLPLEHMHVLHFDSKIVLIGGCKFFFKYNRHSGPSEHSKKVYELDLEKELVVDVVDDSSSPLPHTVESSFFDFYGILYLRMRMADERIFIFTYDTHNPFKDWTMTEGDDNFTHSFCVEVGDDAQRLFIPPAVRIPDLVDSGEYLALSCEHIGGKNMIYAFLVDQLGVCNFQTLEGCFKRVPPSFIYKELPRLVSFGGKGVVGVMISGSREEKEKRIPVLCVLVLHVNAKRVVQHPTRILRRSVRPPTECEFLDWKVLGMHMYSMEGIHDWCPAFVFPNIQCHQENAQEVPRLGRRKWSKLI
ncbi:hypothetical protein PIB30_015449 [Stylosanthes scabra]|uniref:Uncharacterized protein n=1 Tax=Stylosanthes scabra TaxID=79078 RepID=A0ABU6U8M3_9FABA|nr:hypothetical protein [Stylosanthes scabra]